MASNLGKRGAASTQGTFRVVTVEEHPCVVEWFASRLAKAGAVYVTNLSTVDHLAETALAKHVDLVVVAKNRPDSDAFEAVELISGSRGRTRCAFLSASVSQYDIESALNAGATGYFSKLDDPDEIIGGLRTVVRGWFAFGHTVKRVWPTLTRIEGSPSGSALAGQIRSFTMLGALTDREKAVLRCYGLGLSRREIAARLHRSPKTIDKHRTSLMAKLGIRDRVGLALFAIREGLVDVEQIEPLGKDVNGHCHGGYPR